MPEHTGGNSAEYNAEDAQALVDEVFSARLPIAEAIQRLRTRLLDLSSRNRLLRYVYPKRRCVRFIDNPDLNIIFDRLLEGKSVLLRPVPDPPPRTYEQGKKPEARVYAEQRAFNTNYEFSGSEGDNGQLRRTPPLQTVFYPTDLDKFLRRFASEARTIIEETGTNMLYLMFGFLEFYDATDSERSYLAPLLSVPVSLVRTDIDPGTRTYQYVLTYNGDDVAENHTLREKLKQDFRINLPEFDTEESPEEYFAHIRKAVRTQQRWNVKRQLTLGFLSFGKLAIWADLDEKKWKSLLEHPLLKRIFEGTAEEAEGSFHPEDYTIDTHKQADLPLIYDADSSQHSAMIDVLDGHDLVINGPPGTGKSQTITNILANGLVQGKKILFVSEKLAALEVVRHRLEAAGLGDFCLELHSHKTEKKRLLEDIQKRLGKRFTANSQVQELLALLKTQKQRLNRYAALMGSVTCDRLGLTINEIFWAAERRKMALGPSAGHLNAAVLRNAAETNLQEVARCQSLVEVLRSQFDEIGGYSQEHPWWGFTPRLLAPGDDAEIKNIVGALVEQADQILAYANSYATFVEESAPPSFQAIAQACAYINEIPAPDHDLNAALLPRFFPESDVAGARSSAILAQLSSDLERVRNLNDAAYGVLVAGCEVQATAVQQAISRVERHMASRLIQEPIEEFGQNIASLARALDPFTQSMYAAAPAPAPITARALADLRAAIEEVAPFPAPDCPLREIERAISAVRECSGRLRGAIKQLTALSVRYQLPFRTTHDEIIALSGNDPIKGLLPGTNVTEEVLEEATALASSTLGHLTLQECANKAKQMLDLNGNLREALRTIAVTSRQLGIEFRQTSEGVGLFGATLKIAREAPQDLLEHRDAKLGLAQFTQALRDAEALVAEEHGLRLRLEQEFYFDALPEVGVIKNCLRVLRRGDSLFNIFSAEWRAVRRQLREITREKPNKNARYYEQKFSELVCWHELHDRIESHEEFKHWFGALFHGVSTDFGRVRRLHDWHMTSQSVLAKFPLSLSKIDITTIPASVLSQLAAQADDLQKSVDALLGAVGTLDGVLGTKICQELRSNAVTWPQVFEAVDAFCRDLSARVEFLTHYVQQDVPLKRGCALLKAKAELKQAEGQLSALLSGVAAVNEAGGTPLWGLKEFACDSWPRFLEAVAGTCAKATTLLAAAKPFGTADATPADIALLLARKLALDAAWETLAPTTTKAGQWEVAGPTAAVEAGQALVHMIASNVRKGVSAAQAVQALMARDEARAIVARIERDRAVQEMAGDQFLGAWTDIGALLRTHAWGKTVAQRFATAHVSLRSRLLAPDAKESDLHARAILNQSRTAIERLQEACKALDAYGAFDWSLWNGAWRKSQDEDLPQDVSSRLRFAAEHAEAVLAWSRYFAIKQQCVQADLQGLVAVLEERKLAPNLLPVAYEFILYNSLSKAVYSSFPEISRFSGKSHDQLRAQFANLDKEIIRLNGEVFGQTIDKNKRVPEGHAGMHAGDYTELCLLRRELNKQRRHIPIRQLVKRAGRALQEIKPCFMMGPLSVAQYLEPGAVDFDIIVMDEASQLKIEESLGAIVRGKQLVVVGDPKQLPPTSFFDRLMEGEEDDSDESATVVSGMESILDVCQQIFRRVRTLRWHYRSRHESLIAFSNYHFYKNLIVFPSPDAKGSRLGVKCRYIRNGVYKERKNLPEAERVVDAVVEHVMKHPAESLGVVTLNQTQRELIEELLDKKFRTFKECEHFISLHAEQGWPFFVKNLENVQGDERDVIFISTTFGPPPGLAKVRQNFGPISRPEGWRRLNVLFTRARTRVELFTSMRPEDVVVDEHTPLGTKALRDYLEYARRGILAATDEGDREPDSDFEVAVAEVLRARGFAVKPQLGVAGFYIDIAVRNPDRLGEFLAAIECDGATYHSCASARDRDRIRQEILESLGWRGRIYRIWSTDWFYNPRRETARLLEFLEECRAKAQAAPISESEDTATELGDGPELEEHDAIDLELGDEEDVFVEVGNQVTYCHMDKSSEKKTVTIVAGQSNPKIHTVNEETPIARALLGLSAGEIGRLELPSGVSCNVRVLKIERFGQESA